MDKLRVKNSGFVSLVVGANASHAKGEPFVLFLLRGFVFIKRFCFY